MPTLPVVWVWGLRFLGASPSQENGCPRGGLPDLLRSVRLLVGALALLLWPQALSTHRHSKS